MSKQVNIYRNRGAWAYALWTDGEFDHSDTIDADNESEARAEVSGMFPDATVSRVADTEE